MKRFGRKKFILVFSRIIMGGLAAMVGLTVLSKSLRRRSPPLVRAGLEPAVVRPPGALPEKDFMARCICCTRCQDSCPTGAIRLAGPQDAVPTGTPFIEAREVGCNLCLACTETCPTEALQPVTVKSDVRMGTAVVDERTCVSYNRTGICGACFTVCPFRGKAITLGLHNAPTVHDDFCVGCGLCEAACILKGVKAIRVFSGRIWT